MARTAKKSDAQSVATEHRSKKSDAPSVALRDDTRATPTVDLGKQIDKLYKLQQKRIGQQRKVDEIKREEQSLDAEIRAALLDSRLTAAKGKAASFSIHTEVIAQVDDWSALHQWIAEHDAFDLLQRRVSHTAYRELLEAGTVPDGAHAEKLLKSSIRKAGAR